MSVSIRPATEADLEFAITELANAGLPVSDLRADHLVFAATSGGAVIGVIGYEAYGDVGLLRSLIVSRDARGSGTGATLVDALEAEAASGGALELWLLTIDADNWFARHGYVVRERAEAPAAIQGTAEFSGLCPGDAVLMSKQLGQ